MIGFVKVSQKELQEVCGGGQTWEKVKNVAVSTATSAARGAAMGAVRGAVTGAVMTPGRAY